MLVQNFYLLTEKRADAFIGRLERSRAKEAMREELNGSGNELCSC